MKNKDLLFLMIGSCVFFAAVSHVLQLPYNYRLPHFMEGDAVSYWEAAKLIYTEGGKPHPLRPYLYPLIIGLPQLFDASSKNTIEFVIGFNALCWLATIALIFKILKDNTNNKIALICSFIFVSNTSNIINCWTVLAESLFHFLIIICIYFLLNYLKNKQKLVNFILFFTFLYLSIITRPTYFPLIFLIIPLFIWAIYKKYFNVFITTISLLIFTSIIGFSLFKMHQTYGNWTLSYVGNCALYSYFGAYAQVAKPDKTWSQIRKDWLVEAAFRNKKTTRYTDTIPWSTLPSLVNSDLKAQINGNKTGLLMSFGHSLWENSVESNINILFLTDFKNQKYFPVVQKIFFWWGRLHNIVNSLIGLLIMPFLLFRNRYFLWQKSRSLFDILIFNTALGCATILISTVSFSQGDRFHLVVLPFSLVSLGIIYFVKIGIKTKRII
jgi:4-amino-4-deoxy-L-arabinose transferase-like glycosyltransferase